MPLAPDWGLFFFLLFIHCLYMEFSALYAAYAEYAERMYNESDDLQPVDIDTVPHTVDWDRLAEWADVG